MRNVSALSNACLLASAINDDPNFAFAQGYKFLPTNEGWVTLVSGATYFGLVIYVLNLYDCACCAEGHPTTMGFRLQRVLGGNGETAFQVGRATSASRVIQSS